MKKKTEKPFIQVMKLNAMDVIATSKDIEFDEVSIQRTFRNHGCRYY